MAEPELTGLRASPLPGDTRLGEWPLTVLVGVTGVGKSTALRALAQAGAGARVLPDRREVTDAVIFGGEVIRDREERFRRTAAYREAHPGGMAQALGGLWGARAEWGERPIFDGLRGLDEVRYAAQTYPAWRFVALQVADRVRVERLLGRADRFDQVSLAGVSLAGVALPGVAVSSKSAPASAELRARLERLPGVSEVFSGADLEALCALDLPGLGATPEDLLAKVKIVVSERQHYDPAAAAAYLGTLPPARALSLDTAEHSPGAVAQAVREWAERSEGAQTSGSIQTPGDTQTPLSTQAPGDRA